jgi:transposase InsO family protein
MKEIMYRFGVPNNIITDNRTQFTVREFKDFCADSRIKINHASVSHPRSNGQVECSNNMILQGLKPRIFDRIKLTLENGLGNCHRFCGPFILPRVELRVTHHFL